jgi:transposase
MPNALFLPNWTVTEIVVDQAGAYQLAGTYDVQPTGCSKCGTVGQLYKHGTKLITYVDAPVHGRRTFINVRRARYRCRKCGGTFMQPLPDMEADRRMTVRCRQYIQAQCLLKPNTHVAEDIGIDEKIVRQVGKAYA